MHMGVITLGLFSNCIQGLEGAIILAIAHGLVSPALFILCGGILYERAHTRIFKYYRGLALSMPLFSLFFFFFILANIATPLTGNFIGEFLSLVGAFQQSPILTILGASGIFLAAAYSIWLFNRLNFGAPSRYITNIKDIDRLEFHLLFPLLIVTFIIGIYPSFILDSLHLPVSLLLITPLDFFTTLNSIIGNFEELTIISLLPSVTLYNSNNSNDSNNSNEENNDSSVSSIQENLDYEPSLESSNEEFIEGNTEDILNSRPQYFNLDEHYKIIRKDNKGKAGVYAFKSKIVIIFILVLVLI
jgi:NADH:ubiquinone oxidoreductase subunit 5 (subunit L)/multisubunit Na+/H+ antiporter MnhA subunit